MKRNRVMKQGVGLFGFVIVALWSTAAWGQAWVSFVEDPSRISAAPSVIHDIPCNPSCTGTCDPDPGPTCDNACACACEKDMAVGDLDRTTPPRDDLVIVRIQPFFTGGGVSNLLFLNENGVMVDRTAELAPCFNDPTQDRDVAIVDVNPVVGSSLNFKDVVTAATLGEQPRVYMNLGKDSNNVWRGLCLCYDKATDTCYDQSYLSTHSVCFQDERNNCFVDIPALSDDRRISPFTPAPKFCGVAAGDLNDDGCDDLYFVDYDNTLEDRLLFNGKAGNACTGFFTDVTETPSTRLCPNGPPCFNESGFGTGAQITDVNKDGHNDIIKAENGNLDIFYNDAANIGHFNVNQNLSGEFGTSISGETVIFEDPSRDRQGAGTFLPVRHRTCLRASTHRQTQTGPLPDGRGSVLLERLKTTVDPTNTLNVTVNDPIGLAGPTNCAWNTNMTYDIAVLDINGDTKPDIWSGHARGNQVFLWEPPSDCDNNAVPDGCATSMFLCEPFGQ